MGPHVLPQLRKVLYDWSEIMRRFASFSYIQANREQFLGVCMEFWQSESKSVRMASFSLLGHEDESQTRTKSRPEYYFQDYGDILPFPMVENLCMEEEAKVKHSMLSWNSFGRQKRGRRGRYQDWANEVWFTVFHFSDVVIRSTAAEILGSQTPLPKDNATLLIMALDDKNRLVRRAVVDGLVQGKDKNPPSSILLYVLGDKDKQIRDKARAVILKKSTSLLSELKATAKNSRWLARFEVAHIFGKMKLRAVTGIPTLKLLLKDKQWQVRKEAAWALGEMRERSHGAVSQLIKVLRKDKYYQVRLQVVHSLLKIGEKNKTLRALKEAGKKDKESRVRKASNIGASGLERK